MSFDLENPDPNPGDALRDEAGNLLSTRYGRPTREKRVGGKKVDLFFTERKFGRETRIFLEAKDYSNPLTREQVVKIWADYSGIVARHRPSFLLLITRTGLTTDAQAYVQEEQSEIGHQTIRELENEALGLTGYIRSLSEVFDQDGLSYYYVESRAKQAIYDQRDSERRLDSQTVNLFDKLSLWIEDDERRPVAVLGGYGAGKSSLAKRIATSQAIKALKDPLCRRPILIKLGDLWRYSSVEGLLGGMFTHDFPVDGFNTHVFLRLNEKGRLLIILDGFDEMKHAMTWSDFRQQISDLNKLVTGEAKVILLGRPSAFTSAEEHLHVLRGMKKWDGGLRRIPDWPEFVEFDLEEFTRDERSAFVSGYLQYRASLGPHADVGEGSWIRGRVQEVDKLADADPEIFSKPVHAKILVDMASDPHVDLSRFANGITRWGLYELFFSELAERETAKPARRQIGEGDRLRFLREVAFWLWTARNGSISFSAADLPDRLLDGISFGGAPDLDAAKREYLTGAFLEKKAGDIFYFGHRSFAEYLVAHRMIEIEPSPSEQSVYSGLVRGGVELFLREAPDRSKFNAWANTLSSAQGEIHVEYLAFLAEMVGGRDVLAASLPDSSFWKPILGIFDEDMGTGSQVPIRIRTAMMTSNNNLFFLLLSLLQYIGPLQTKNRVFYSYLIASALLDRLFTRATIDTISRKASVETDGDEARALAYKIVPGLESSIGERQLVFRGERLLAEKAEKLRLLGVDIVRQAPAMVAGVGDTHLKWSEVLAHMSKEGKENAMVYFRHSGTLKNVFTKTSVHSRAIPNALKLRK